MLRVRPASSVTAKSAGPVITAVWVPFSNSSGRPFPSWRASRMARPVVKGILVAPLRRISPCSCTVPCTDSLATRNFKSARFMVYGTGGASGFLAGLPASSISRLYSSRGSVTLPAAGTGGRASSSAAAKQGRTSTHATIIDKILFTCHLPFSRADRLILEREPDFRRSVRRPSTAKVQMRGTPHEWGESQRASLPTSRPGIYRQEPELPLESASIRLWNPCPVTVATERTVTPPPQLFLRP